MKNYNITNQFHFFDMIFSYSKQYFVQTIAATIAILCISIASYLANPSFMIYVFGAISVFLMIIIVWSYKKKYFEWTEDYLKFNFLFQPRKYYFKDFRNCKFSDDSYIFQFNKETVTIKKKNIKEEELPIFLSKFNQLNLDFKNNNQPPIPNP